MPHKCDGCFWRTDWEDESGSYPICERLWWQNFEEAKAECAKPGPCDHHLADRKAKEIIGMLNDIPN